MRVVALKSELELRLADIDVDTGTATELSGEIVTRLRYQGHPYLDPYVAVIVTGPTAPIYYIEKKTSATWQAPATFTDARLRTAAAVRARRPCHRERRPSRAPR
ncbi:MAG TPA: hypothetical protein VM925_13590 [Labilithrix sp.]|jgi:hypothetical protein|nr:hypothetical protein [Labilithrix sp.]